MNRLGLALSAVTLAASILLSAAGTFASPRTPFGLKGNLTGSDLRALFASTSEVLDQVLAQENADRVAAWQNEESGNFGTIQVGKASAHLNLDCFMVRHIFHMKNRADTVPIIVRHCKDPEDNAWKIAE